MNPRNSRILFVILTAGVIVYGLLTYQWLLMIVGILLLALAFAARNAIR